ncbi:hypothetical protein [Vibrio sp. SCSIO 43137]|uniref:hypothetical protein n=1 Tax=Vibrio sp. SCSIO 43137 TaxID=3021011 RepID=UPI0023081B2E|nr:hypothetical protein [Vibrio sp. SCSIO 43137]WCE32498.1 hypothetical protein PK654_18580 [Vibrio sp. SCSIO 43137]
MAGHLISEPEKQSNFLSQWWAKLAYHHKWAEAMLYLMFISGVLLWNRVELAWQAERWVLLTHMLVGISLFSVIVGAFWASHRRLITASNKPFLRKTGTIIEWLLVICSLSGFYLFFFGVPGNQLGFLIQDIHFYSSWLLAPLVFRHAMRWSVLKIIKTKK